MVQEERRSVRAVVGDGPVVPGEGGTDVGAHDGNASWARRATASAL
jgi:hypothetical protein